jgi:hypothetical protein
MKKNFYLALLFDGGVASCFSTVPKIMKYNYS